MNTAPLLTGIDDIEIPCVPSLSQEQVSMVELHSVVNLIGVLAGGFSVIKGDLPEEKLDKTISALLALGNAIREKALAGSPLLPLHSQIKSIDESFQNFLREKNAYFSTSAGEKIKNVLAYALGDLDSRIVEWEQRRAKKPMWRLYSTEEISSVLWRFFHTMADFSNGRFRIVSDPNTKSSTDYLFLLQFSTDLEGCILMPSVFLEVLRDLLANARKYTPVGGTLRALVENRDDTLEITVEDTGFGIPEQEVLSVVQFGYRASNVADRKTFGAGFGLTKAISVVKNYSGRMWIASRLGTGTRITLRIPGTSTQTA